MASEESDDVALAEESYPASAIDLRRLLESEDLRPTQKAALIEESYPTGFSVLAAALGELQPDEIAADEAARADADEGWLVKLARADAAGAAGEAAVDARAFLDAAEGDSDDSGCWSSDAGGSDEGGADDQWFDPTARVQHGVDLGTHRNLEHLGDWHAYNEMTTALQGLIQAAAKGPRPASPEAAERARCPEAKPLEPRVINRRDPKEAGKGIFYPRPRESWGAPKVSWRPDAPWERNMRQVDGSLAVPRDVEELGERLVSAAQDWAAIQKMEQKGRGQLAGIADVLSSVRQCLEFIHGGSLGVEELKPYFERMLRHVQHLYVAMDPDAIHRMHGGEAPPELPYRDVSDRKYHSKPPVPSHFVDSTWAKRAPACKPAPRRMSKAEKRRAERRRAKAATDTDADVNDGGMGFDQSELDVLLGMAQKKAEPTAGTGYSARAVSKILGKAPGTPWEDPDELAAARESHKAKVQLAKDGPAARKGEGKRPPTSFKVKEQLKEELMAAQQGVVALEEKALRLRAGLDTVRLQAAAEAAERDTATLAAALAGAMEGTEVLLTAARQSVVEPAMGFFESPDGSDAYAGGMEGPRTAQGTSAAALAEEVEPTTPGELVRAARRERQAALQFAAGGYSHERVVEVGSTRARKWVPNPETKDQANNPEWRYQGSAFRVDAARKSAEELAARTREVEYEVAAKPGSAAAGARRGAKARKGFKVTEKHEPMAGKFLFDGAGRVPRSVKYTAVMKANVSMHAIWYTLISRNVSEERLLVAAGGGGGAGAERGDEGCWDRQHVTFVLR